MRLELSANVADIPAALLRNLLETTPQELAKTLRRVCRERSPVRLALDDRSKNFRNICTRKPFFPVSIS